MSDTSFSGPPSGPASGLIAEAKTLIGEGVAFYDDDGPFQLPARLFEQLPFAIYVCDRAGTLVRYNRRAVELWGRTPVLGNEKFCGSFKMYRTDGSPMPHDECYMADVLRTGDPVRQKELEIERPDGQRGVAVVDIEAIRDKDGVIIGAVNCFQDATERREWENRQRVLVAELQHRTRNLIAVVNSISRQTMDHTESVEAFQEEFGRRLEALARVQGLLSRSDEDRITIDALIDMELDAMGATRKPSRLHVEGPPVPLRNSVVQTLALALHELATNARKYGALSNGHGVLTVRWRTYQDAQGSRLAIDWSETGGKVPNSVGDERRGYGRELIERALPYALDARTSFVHDETGLTCAIDMPLGVTSGERGAE